MIKIHNDNGRRRALTIVVVVVVIRRRLCGHDNGMMLKGKWNSKIGTPTKYMIANRKLLHGLSSVL